MTWILSCVRVCVYFLLNFVTSQFLVVLFTLLLLYRYNLKWHKPSYRSMCLFISLCKQYLLIDSCLHISIIFQFFYFDCSVLIKVLIQFVRNIPLLNNLNFSKLTDSANFVSLQWFKIKICQISPAVFEFSETNEQKYFFIFRKRINQDYNLHPSTYIQLQFVTSLYHYLHQKFTNLTLHFSLGLSTQLNILKSLPKVSPSPRVCGRGWFKVSGRNSEVTPPITLNTPIIVSGKALEYTAKCTIYGQASKPNPDINDAAPIAWALSTVGSNSPIRT